MSLKRLARREPRGLTEPLFPARVNIVVLASRYLVFACVSRLSRIGLSKPCTTTPYCRCCFGIPTPEHLAIGVCPHFKRLTEPEAPSKPRGFFVEFWMIPMCTKIESRRLRCSQLAGVAGRPLGRPRACRVRFVSNHLFIAQVKSQHHDRKTPHQDIRHHAPRRRAIARSQHEPDRKMEIAQALVDLGVDVIEAGFRSPRRATSKLFARSPSIRGSVICGLARCNEMDIDRAWEAAQIRRGRADPRLSRHQRPSRVQAQDDQGNHREGRPGRARGGQSVRQRRVLARRRRPHRARFFFARWSRRPLRPGPPRSIFPTRSAMQLHAHGPRDSQSARACAQHRQSGYQRPLPQRPWSGRGQ